MERYALNTEASSKRQNGKARANAKTDATNSSRSQDERSEEMRSRLITASIGVLRERGFAGFNTEAVVQNAGVSRGALLHHYRRKRDLILAVHEHVYQIAVEKSIESAEAVTDQSMIFDEMLKDAESFFLGEHFFSVLGIVLSANTDPDLKTEILEASQKARLPIEAAWVKVMSEYMPRTLAENLVYMTYNMVRGSAMRTLWEDDAKKYAEVTTIWKSMMIDALKRENIEWPVDQAKLQRL
jgi:AcrR family transcriptional regulator